MVDLIIINYRVTRLGAISNKSQPGDSMPPAGRSRALIGPGLSCVGPDAPARWSKHPGRECVGAVWDPTYSLSQHLLACAGNGLTVSPQLCFVEFVIGYSQNWASVTKPGGVLIHSPCNQELCTKGERDYERMRNGRDLALGQGLQPERLHLERDNCKMLFESLWSNLSLKGQTNTVHYTLLLGTKTDGNMIRTHSRHFESPDHSCWTIHPWKVCKDPPNLTKSHFLRQAYKL